MAFFPFQSPTTGGSCNYSTDEHEIGTWIDGTTLYEKTVYIEVPYGNSEYLTDAVGNINVVSLQGYVKQYSGAVVSLGYFYSQSDRFQAYYSSSDYKIHVAPAQNWQHQTHTGYVTIRYTKPS